MSSEPRHVVLVPFPEVAPVVEPWLERSDGSRPSHGVPAHVTLLFPCPGDAEDVGAVLAGATAFDVLFRESRRFGEPRPVLYLAPERPDRFLALIAALVERFPGWPPYGGIHDTVVPHLTVAVGALCDEAEATVAPALPLRGRAREALLLREEEHERWQQVARFPFPEA